MKKLAALTALLSSSPAFAATTIRVRGLPVAHLLETSEGRITVPAEDLVTFLGGVNARLAPLRERVEVSDRQTGHDAVSVWDASNAGGVALRVTHIVPGAPPKQAWVKASGFQIYGHSLAEKLQPSGDPGKHELVSEPNPKR